MISEFQLLRWSLLDVLHENQLQLDEAESRVVNSAMDEAIRESVAAFALAQSRLRERVIAALSHDLRTPLQIIASCAEMLRAGSGGQPALADRILENKDRMDHMLKQLLDAAAFHTGERLPLTLQQFNLGQLVEEVCRESNALRGGSVRIDVEPVVGWWDRNALRRALDNLLGNAAKYGDMRQPVEVRLSAQHGRAMLTVHNGGEPVPADQLESVFKVFFRSRSARDSGQQGWGVGLPFVRSVAESHGGSIGMSSAKEFGTTVTLDLPVDARPFMQAPTLD